MPPKEPSDRVVCSHAGQSVASRKPTYRPETGEQSPASASGCIDGDTTAPSVRAGPLQSKRRHHPNSPERILVTQWMVNEAARIGSKGVTSKAVSEFPHIFKGAPTEKAKLEKARRWWCDREKTLSCKKDCEIASGPTGTSRNATQPPQAKLQSPQTVSNPPRPAANPPQVPSQSPGVAPQPPGAASKRPQAASNTPQEASTQPPQATLQPPQTVSNPPQIAANPPQLPPQPPGATPQPPGAAAKPSKEASKLPQEMLQLSQAASKPSRTSVNPKRPTTRSHAPPSKKRHHPNSPERLLVTKWMVNEAARNGPKRVISKAVSKFSHIFLGAPSAKAKREKARRWWCDRETTLSCKKDRELVSGSSHNTNKSSQAKAQRAPAVSQSLPAVSLPSEATEDSKEPTTTSGAPSFKRRHHVNSLSERLIVTQWMVKEAAVAGPRKVISKAVPEFPQIFCGTPCANLEKARRWWRNKEKTLSLEDEHVVTIARTGKRRKAFAGRGRKQAEWVSNLHSALYQEYERLESAGVMFSPAVLQQLARDLISSAPLGSPFHGSVVYNGVPIVEKITVRWVQHFMMQKGIVVRGQTGKLCTSPEKILCVEKEVAFHMGFLRRGFDSGRFREEDMEVADEIHFVFNMDNGKTLGLGGCSDFEYADVASGGESLTMMVRISGGPAAIVEVPFIVFKDENRSYPIKGVPDNVPGVCYRSQPKGWMDAIVFSEWLQEPRAIAKKVDRGRELFVDLCGGHIVGDDVTEKLKSLNSTLHKCPANASQLVLPTDGALFENLKGIWNKHWEQYQSRFVPQKGRRQAKGRLSSPKKKWYLDICARVVREFNELKDKDGINYARRAMIRTGMALDTDGVWRESQLRGDLQDIISKHRDHFNGTPVHKFSEAVRSTAVRAQIDDVVK